jgi:hypothetical protein
MGGTADTEEFREKFRIFQAEEGEAVRGLIVGRQVDDKLKYATKGVPVGLVALRVFDFKGEKGKEDWIPVSSA